MGEAERKQKEEAAAGEIMRQASYLRRSPERTAIEDAASEVLRYWSDRDR